MTRAPSFRERIRLAAESKESPIIVALDLTSSPSPELRETGDEEAWLDKLQASATDIIDRVQASVCAIKLNFHLLLPLSASRLAAINRLAKSYGLSSIADIKLNDIEQTNEVALDRLAAMGFDCVIANPFMGSLALRALANQARSKNSGVICLAYMSHPGAIEGYGLSVLQNSTHQPLYKIFIERALAADADGIVVGATQSKILSELAAADNSSQHRIPIYSPGIGTQGASIEEAVKSGCDYLIVGRSIVDAKEPKIVAQELKSRAKSAKRAHSSE